MAPVMKVNHLKPVFCVDTRSREAFDIWIQRSRCPKPSPNKSKILRYLRQAPRIGGIGVLERDPFREDKVIRNAFSVATDGVWVWFTALAYWFEFEDIALNSDFIVHMNTCDFKVPSRDQLDLTQVDSSQFASFEYFYPK